MRREIRGGMRRRNGLRERTREQQRSGGIWANLKAREGSNKTTKRTTPWLSGETSTSTARREERRHWNRKQVGWEFEVEGGKAGGESTRRNQRQRGLHRRGRSRWTEGLHWGGAPLSRARIGAQNIGKGAGIPEGETGDRVFYPGSKGPEPVFQLSRSDNQATRNYRDFCN